MNGKPVIWIEDQAAQFFDELAHDTGKNPAVQWLETVFTGRWALGTFHDADPVPGPAYTRPMIELIDQDDETSEDDYAHFDPMDVTPGDYDDPGR
jgi:hypothetical protein